MTKTNKDYYVFDGQNATTGKPNEITGRMSNYGEVLTFRSKKEAVEYANNSRGTGIVKAGTKSIMRKYCLGMTVANFEEYLKYQDYSEVK